MAYNSRTADGVDRAAKLAADIFCALLILSFALIFFGWIGGIIGFVIVEGWLIAIDYLAPQPEEAAGAAIR
jgi:hypothetical protein